MEYGNIFIFFKDLASFANPLNFSQPFRRNIFIMCCIPDNVLFISPGVQFITVSPLEQRMSVSFKKTLVPFTTLNILLKHK